MKYFSYGSNMLQSRLEDQKNRKGELVGEVVDNGMASLEGYSLAFNKLSQEGVSGKANIVQEKESETLGVVYELTGDQIALLDNIEGVGYKRVSIVVIFDDEPIEVDTYIALDEATQEGLFPTRDYLDFIIQGAETHGFPEDYISSLKVIGSNN